MPNKNLELRSSLDLELLGFEGDVPRIGWCRTRRVEGFLKFVRRCEKQTNVMKKFY